MLSLIVPVGPLTVAPMVDPSSAVTDPVSCPQVTWLDDMATPPLTAVPISLTTNGVDVSELDMVRTTATWSSRFGAEVWNVP